jgi:hypothetical protein
MSTLSEQLQNELDEAAQHLRTALAISARTEKSHVIQQISMILSSIECIPKYCQSVDVMSNLLEKFKNPQQ